MTTPKETKTEIMEGSISRPKVFISYSWSSPQHEQWVSDLAERLTGDGVVVVLDKWDLKEGQDKHAFMEKMVQDKEIKKVLVICDKEYQNKANKREGGVGTETQLISKEVYEKVEQEKFIAIVKEFESPEKPRIPHFMESRIYIDLSSDETYEENYQKLVRNLYNKPLVKKPPLGTPPAYIVGEEQTVFKLSHKVAQIRSAILNDRGSAQGLSYDYLENFLLTLEDFRLQGGSSTDFDERVLESINKMLPLRDDFVEFTNTVFKYGSKIDLERMHDFFEKLIRFRFKPEDATSWTEVDFDNYKFFIYELFLYFITTLFQLKKYQEAAFFINAQYFFHHPTSNELDNVSISIFTSYVRSLDEIRNKRLNLRRISVTADLIKQRADRKDIKFDQIIETDLILHYLTELEKDDHPWFPRCSVYNPKFGEKIELFDRMVSMKHFNNVKALFEVSDVNGLQEKISKYKERVEQGQRQYIDSWDYNIPLLEKIIDLESIGKTK